MPDTVLNVLCANQKPPIDGSLNVQDLEELRRRVQARLARDGRPQLVARDERDLRAPVAARRSASASRLRPYRRAIYDWLAYYEPIIHRSVAVSAEIAQKLTERIPHRAEHVVIRPYAVDVPDISRRVGYSPTERPLRLVYAGRLSERQKRVSDLARLAELLNEAG